MTTRIAKLLGLTRQEKAVLLTAALLLPVFSVALRAFGLPRFQAWLTRPCPAAGQNCGTDTLARIGALVNIAAAHGPAPNSCLTRSLLLTWLLRRRGVSSQLRIGVRLHRGELEAHAWVEHAGRPINDAADVQTRFAPLDGPFSYKTFS